LGGSGGGGGVTGVAPPNSKVQEAAKWEPNYSLNKKLFYVQLTSNFEPNKEHSINFRAKEKSIQNIKYLYITFTSNQIALYYLKLKNYLQYIALI
jgi:hypothetical protein